MVCVMLQKANQCFLMFLTLALTNLENDPGTYISASGKHNVTFSNRDTQLLHMDHTVLEEWKRLHMYGVITDSSQTVF